MLVEEIMQVDPITIGPTTTLDQAYDLMRRRGIRHLPVLEATDVVGIVTDRDLRLATSRLAERPFAPDARVAEVMSRPVHTAHPRDPIETAARTMRELKIGCLPIVESETLVGIVTVIDILDALLMLTGVACPSGRVEVRLSDRPGELARLTALLSDKQVNIHSILSYPNGEQRGRIVLRVGTIEIRVLVDALRAAGFEVLWPPPKPCHR